MDEELDNDMCCATCIKGYLVQDNDLGERIHCKLKDEYMPTDDICEEFRD